MKKIAIFLGLAVTLLLLVIVYRTSAYQPQVIKIQKSAPFSIDSQAAASRLAEALRIRTVTKTSSMAYEPAAFIAFHELLKKFYPQTHKTLKLHKINEFALLYKWRGSNTSEKPILLMAHQDVVPVPEEELAEWTHPPFAGKIEDGYIWGRGTLDVKSGVLGILEAIEILIQDGFTPTRDVYLAFGHDEEIGGIEGAKAIAERLRQKKITFEFILDEGGSITKGIVPGVADPVAMVGIAEKGFLSLELSVETDGGHSSMPSRELSIEILSRAITALYDNPSPANLDNALTFLNYVAPKMSITKRAIFANTWLFEPFIKSRLEASTAMNATIRTSMAPTMFRAGVKDNVLPTSGSAVVNFRIAPGETIETVKHYVKSTINDSRIKISNYGGEGNVFASNPSPRSSVSSRSFELIRDSILTVANDPALTVAPYIVLGATDSRYFTDLSPNVYRFLFNRLEKDDLKLIHGIDERISIENYRETIQFYFQLIINSSAI
ncbi:MAG: M20 family peptidase [Myxococcota bacterium]|nr:M20 family peptidase [Myxococcota bacterium]